MRVCSVKSNGITKRALVMDEKLVPFTTLSKYTAVKLPEWLFIGTPDAVVIHNGDTVECRIDGFPTLSNLVKGAA